MGARLPDFLIIGAQKAGTTSLWAYLRTHPQVFLPDLKEPNFFIAEGNLSRGLEWYRSLFDAAGPDQVVGEASPGYTMFPLFAGVPRRIADTAPGVKLVYVIRDPVARMVSAWLHLRADFLEGRPLGVSLLSDTKYLSMSQYAMQIEQYLDHFDRDSLLVVRAEDLDSNRAATVAKVCAFLGVEPELSAATDERLNTSESKMLPLRRTRILYKGLVGVKQPALADRLKSKTWPGVTHRSVDPGDLEVDDELRDRLLGYLKVDLMRLRELVGPGFDLWGYA